MSSEWDRDDFFKKDNWEKPLDRHAVEYAKKLQEKATEEEELRLKEQKGAEEVLVFTFLLAHLDQYNIKFLDGAKLEICKIINRNGGNGSITKVSIFNQNGIVTAPMHNISSIQQKLAKVVIDPLPSEARVHMLTDLTHFLEEVFSLATHETRDSFVYTRVMTRKEAELNF